MISRCKAMTRIPPSRRRWPSEVITALDASGLSGHEASKDGLGRRIPARLNVEPGWLQRLKQGDRIDFPDLRGKAGALTIDEILSATEVEASSIGTAYLEEGIALTHFSHPKRRHPAFETFIGPIAEQCRCEPCIGNH